MGTATVIVPTVNRPHGLAALLRSLQGRGGQAEVIVVDNGSPGTAVRDVCAEAGVDQLIRFERNTGYSHAVNVAARRAGGNALVLLNDDCVCDRDFVAELTGALDAAAGRVMAAGVLRDARHPALIDTAGMELDGTLLSFDYLNGEPLSALESQPEDPVGPCAAAAAFERSAFLEVGGFDERIFAYGEDADLVLRLRRLGGRCALAPRARGVHEHSATLGAGSREKDYLTGFGRGYLLRKWGVVSPRRLPGVLARDGVVVAGQAIVDRNLAGVRGRWRGYRSAVGSRAYPQDAAAVDRSITAYGTLRRRAQRRARLRRGGEAALR